MEAITHTRLGLDPEMNRRLNGTGLPVHNRWGAQPVPSREFPPSTTLFLQGNSPREVFYLERGLVKLIRLSDSGHELAIGLCAHGSLLGAASVIGKASAIVHDFWNQ
jgi:CRP-like cAMP-binding protein